MKHLITRFLTPLKILAVLTIFFIAIYQRIGFFDQVGKDIYAHEKAITDLFAGRNPYVWTLESYSNPDDPGNHGYAYLPGLLYVNAFLFIISLLTKISFQYLWKVPVLLADIGVGILLVRVLHKKNFWALVFGLLVWFFNPYFYMKANYVYADPLVVFFLLLALYCLEKDDVLAGVFYAISVALKTFPIILFPLFLLKSKNRFKFLAAGTLIAIFISVPFMRSIADFTTYLQGAVFVHSERFIQGRPFLFYISYFYKVELFQIIPLKVYSYLAMFSGWVVSSLLYFLKWLRDKYILSIIPFVGFYLFTPVLNRTYLIWCIPILVLGLYSLFSQKRYKWLYYVLLGGFWWFYYSYLLPWKDGFHIWRP